MAPREPFDSEEFWTILLAFTEDKRIRPSSDQNSLTIKRRARGFRCIVLRSPCSRNTRSPARHGPARTPRTERCCVPAGGVWKADQRPVSSGPRRFATAPRRRRHDASGLERAGVDPSFRPVCHHDARRSAGARPECSTVRRRTEDRRRSSMPPNCRPNDAAISRRFHPRVTRPCSICSARRTFRLYAIHDEDALEFPTPSRRETDPSGCSLNCAAAICC